MTFEHRRLKTEMDFPMTEMVPATPAIDPRSSDQGVGAETFYTRHGKRIFDLTFTLFCAPIWVPIVLVLALIARLDGGPAFFGHARVGRRGRIFHCWKLRTMVPDAEGLLHQYLQADPKAAAEWAANQKLTHDPRITRIGKLLRKSSLDEFPQFFNVLMGDMSLVGPRPVTKSELERYGIRARAYLSQRPGVTGPWQVEGRHFAADYDRRIAMDVTYAKSCSFQYDISLILRTLPAVMMMRGR